MRDPDIRRRILSEDPLAQSTFALLSRLSNERVFRLSNPPDYAPPRDQSVAAIAARQGRRPEEVAYDLLLEEEGRALLFAPIVNSSEERRDGIGWVRKCRMRWSP